MSDVYRLESPDAAYILKVYLHNRHPKSAIQAEIDFLLDLLDHDIPVAAPRSNNDAAYVNEIDAPEGPRCAVLFEAIDGEQPQEVPTAAALENWPAACTIVQMPLLKNMIAGILTKSTWSRRRWPISNLTWRIEKGIGNICAPLAAIWWPSCMDWYLGKPTIRPVSR